MAKKKTAKPNASGAPATPASPSDAYVGRVKSQFDQGSYAGVRKLAAAAPADLTPAAKAQLDAIVGMTRVDPVQLAIAVGGIVLVLIVGLLTLS